METVSSPALSIALAIGAFVICLTLVSIYTAFGPPAKQLSDPFEDHED
ncbi:MAG: photosystem II reaction center protein PsbN [Pseudanabaenaceae cyanobacterium]